MLTPSRRYLPDLIKGDLDSIRADVRTFYSNHVSPSCFCLLRLTICEKNVPVVEDENQDATDLMKCVNSVQENEDGQGPVSISVEQPDLSVEPHLRPQISFFLEVYPDDWTKLSTPFPTYTSCGGAGESTL
jgi:thiamine pyrophosphokinase